VCAAPPLVRHPPTIIVSSSLDWCLVTSGYSRPSICGMASFLKLGRRCDSDQVQSIKVLTPRRDLPLGS